jgi:hypothetical protein
VKVGIEATSRNVVYVKVDADSGKYDLLGRSVSTVFHLNVGESLQDYSASHPGRECHVVAYKVT